MPSRDPCEQVLLTWSLQNGWEVPTRSVGRGRCLANGSHRLAVMLSEPIGTPQWIHLKIEWKLIFLHNFFKYFSGPCSSMQAFWPEFLFVGMNGEAILEYHQLSPAPLPCHILNWNIFREKPMQTSQIMCHREQLRCSILHQMKLYSKGLHSCIKQIPITQTWLMQLHHLKHQHRALSTSASLCRATSLGQNSPLAHPHTETMNTVPI